RLGTCPCTRGVVHQIELDETHARLVLADLVAERGVERRSTEDHWNGTLLREQHRDRSADAGAAPRDDDHTTRELQIHAVPPRLQGLWRKCSSDSGFIVIENPG